MDKMKDGRAPSGQALVASDGAASVSTLPGFDPSRELLPCPFCGGDATFGYRGKNYGANVIECNNKKCPCLPFTNALSHSEAIAAWNTRAAPDEARLLSDIAAMMSEFVDNWPTPKRLSTALKLIAKTIRHAIATDARRAETLGSVHEGAGPQDIAQNGDAQ